MAFSCYGDFDIFITNSQSALLPLNSYGELQTSATSILYYDQPFVAWRAKDNFKKNVQNCLMGLVNGF